MNMMIELPDPMLEDPNNDRMTLITFLERVAQQQFPSQNRLPYQKYGLALGLFRDVGVAKGFDLRSKLESHLQMSVEDFIGLGYWCGALRAASSGYGSVTYGLLAAAHAQGMRYCEPQNVKQFFDKTCRSIPEFKKEQAKFLQECQKIPSKPQFEFNSLQHFPIIDLGQDRYLSIDPDMVIDRVTSGLFFDVFDIDRLNFSTNFGHAFEKYVGVLLKRVVNESLLMSDDDFTKLKTTIGYDGKICDWGYVNGDDTILLENKGMRPTLRLMTVTDEESIHEISDKLVKAINQIAELDEQFRAGKIKHNGQIAKEAKAYVIVMYGQLYTVNKPLWKELIQEKLKEREIPPKPFLVLSLQDLDSVIKLVEYGHNFATLIEKLAIGELSLQNDEELKHNAISSTTFELGKSFGDSLVPDHLKPSHS